MPSMILCNNAIAICLYTCLKRLYANKMNVNDMCQMGATTLLQYTSVNMNMLVIAKNTMRITFFLVCYKAPWLLWTYWTLGSRDCQRLVLVCTYLIKDSHIGNSCPLGPNQ